MKKDLPLSVKLSNFILLLMYIKKLHIVDILWVSGMPLKTTQKIDNIGNTQ